MALSNSRNTPARDPHCLMSGPIAADVVIYCGALVAMDTSGNFRPARASTTDVIIGRAKETFDNTDGSAGDLTVTCDVGVFRWDNSADGDAITRAAHKGAICYAVDDDQVAATSNANARVPAGIVVDVDSSGVWVATGAAAGGAFSRTYSGTYTPTITVSGNTTASTVPVGWFTRVGNLVTFTVRASVSHTAGAPTASTIDVSLPIASAFDAAADAGGVVTGTAISLGAVVANTTDDRLTLNYSNTGTGALVVQASGHYLIK